MTLEDFCKTLPKAKQIKLAIKLARLALPIWDEYVQNNSPAYRDSVVGLNHTVSKQLLADTIDAIEKHRSKFIVFGSKARLLKLYSGFDDPIVALQDGDWELPEEVCNTFYSVYNLLESVTGERVTSFGKSVIYVSINQAIDAIETAGILSERKIKEILFQEGE